MSDGDGFTLAAVRHSDHTDVVVDAGFQAVDFIMTGAGLHKVLEDGNAFAGRHHCDSVAGDGGGVERRPGEADGGVAHFLEAEVSQRWDLCGGRGRGGQRHGGGTTDTDADGEGRGRGLRRRSVSGNNQTQDRHKDK